MEDNSSPRTIAFAYREKRIAVVCVIATLALGWFVEAKVSDFVSIDNTIIHYAVRFVIMLGVFYLAFSMLNRMDFLNKVGRCTVYPDGRVRLRMGGRQYDFPSVSEVIGGMWSMFVFDSFPTLRVSTGREKVNIDGCPEKGKDDFGETALYELFTALVESNDRLQPVKDIWGDETEYWYAVYAEKE